MRIIFFSILISTLIFLEDSLAKEKKLREVNLSNLHYPELEVRPLASRRLKMERAHEGKSAWKSHFSVQTSALLTLAAGVMVGGQYPEGADDQQKQSVDWASMAGLAIGGAWLATTGYLMYSHTPYADGWRRIKKMSSKTTSDRLVRERLAEEAINDAGSLGRKIAIFSTATNFLASAYVTTVAEGTPRIVGALAMVAAFTPLVFPYRWTKIRDQHREYKRKIYGPLATVGVIEVEGKLAPGIVWNYSF